MWFTGLDLKRNVQFQKANTKGRYLRAENIEIQCATSCAASSAEKCATWPEITVFGPLLTLFIVQISGIVGQMNL